MPIYVKAGAIIPFDPVRQYTSEEVSEPTTLRIYQGASGEFTLYEDDGISQEYLKGKGTWTRISWDDKRKQLTLEAAPPDGRNNIISNSRKFKVLVLPEGSSKEVSYDGKKSMTRF
jgi:alpha-glucosidase/alpha-D-xyloside xylohydrolase